MFSGSCPANDISSQLVIGGSRRHNMGHHRVILRSNSFSQAEVAASHGKDSCEKQQFRKTAAIA
jgi:hypothetical protein